MTTRFRFAARAGAAPDPRQDVLAEGELRIGRAPGSGLRLKRPEIRFEHAVSARPAENSLLKQSAAPSLARARRLQGGRNSAQATLSASDPIFSAGRRTRPAAKRWLS